MFAQDQGGFGDSDGRGVHDFVGLAFFQDAVLMDSGFVGEGVFADDGFVALDDQAGQCADHSAGGIDFGGVDAGIDAGNDPGACAGP